MRFKINIKLNSVIIPKDYQKTVLSLLKFGFSKFRKEYFEKKYESGANLKAINYAVLLPERIKMDTGKKNNNNIFLSKPEITVLFSSYDPETLLYYLDILTVLKNKKINYLYKNDLEMRVELVRMLDHPEILGKESIYKTMSGIIVRDHTKEKKDWYYTLNDKEGVDILKRNILSQIKTQAPEIEIKESDLSLEAKDVKIHWVNHCNIRFPVSRATIKITAPQNIQKMIFLSGIGGGRSRGFGFLKFEGGVI